MDRKPTFFKAIRKIGRAATYIISSIALILPMLLMGAYMTQALEEPLSPQANGDNPLKIVIKPASEVQVVDEKGKGDLNENKSQQKSSDLIEDLVFPFKP